LIAFILKPFNPGKTILINLVFVIPFIPYLIEFLVSGFNPVVRFEFEKKLFFLSAPLLIPVFLKITGFRNYKLALLVFSASVVTLTIYSLIMLVIKGVIFDPGAYLNGAYILRYNFEAVSGLHPTAYSIFALSSTVFLCYSDILKTKAFRTVFISISAFLIIFVLFVATRIALFTGVFFIFIWIFKTRMSLLKKIFVIYGAILLVIILSSIVPSLNSRMDEIIALKNGKIKPDNTLSQRLLIMDCTWKLISGNLLFGNGTENSQIRLNECYMSKGWPAGSEKSYDPHNQYLLFGLNYGIFALIVFLVCLLIIFRKVIRFPEGSYYMFAVLIFFMSESLLESQMGVYYFGIISLVMYNVLPKLKTLESSF
jgi:O-antigen ligase